MALFKAHWWTWKTERLYLDNMNQQAMVRALTGPALDLGLSTSAFMLQVYATVIFAGNMPLITIAGALALWVNFFADKIALLRLQRRPPFLGTALIRAVVEYLPFAIALHTGIAIYTISQMQQLSPNRPSLSALKAAASRSPPASPTRSPAASAGAQAMRVLAAGLAQAPPAAPLAPAAAPWSLWRLLAGLLGVGMGAQPPAGALRGSLPHAASPSLAAQPSTHWLGLQARALQEDLATQAPSPSPAPAPLPSPGAWPVESPSALPSPATPSAMPSSEPSSALFDSTPSGTPSSTPSAIPAADDPYGYGSYSYDYYFDTLPTFLPPLPPVVSTTGCTCKSNCFVTPQLSGAYTSSCLVHTSADLQSASPTPLALPSSAPAAVDRCSAGSSQLKLNTRMAGLEAPCSVPSYGVSNSGCNCTSACGHYNWVSKPYWQQYKTSGSYYYSDDDLNLIFNNLMTCEVDASCMSPYIIAGATRSGFYDFCYAPLSQTCNRTRAAYTTYCQLYFYVPACNDPKRPLSGNLLAMGRLLTPSPGVTVTFSFIDQQFLKALDPTTSAPKAETRGQGILQQPACSPLNATSSSSLGVFGRLLDASTLPLIVALAFVLCLFFVGAFHIAFSVAANCIAAALVLRKEGRHGEAARRKAAESAVLVKPSKGSKGEYTVSFKQVRHGLERRASPLPLSPARAPLLPAHPAPLLFPPPPLLSGAGWRAGKDYPPRGLVRAEARGPQLLAPRAAPRVRGAQPVCRAPRGAPQAAARRPGVCRGGRRV